MLIACMFDKEHNIIQNILSVQMFCFSFRSIHPLCASWDPSNHRLSDRGHLMGHRWGITCMVRRYCEGKAISIEFRVDNEKLFAQSNYTSKTMCPKTTLHKEHKSLWIKPVINLLAKLLLFKVKIYTTFIQLHLVLEGFKYISILERFL